jgi:predicted kinase
MGYPIMKKLIIVRGLPGSGKSTLVKDLFLEEDPSDVMISAHCCADDFMVNDEGEYQFVPSKLSLVHQKCQEKARDAMVMGIHLVIVSNTSTQEWEMKPYIKLAEEYGYRMHSIIVENRHNGTSIHGVPEDKIQVMKDRFEVSL